MIRRTTIVIEPIDLEDHQAWMLRLTFYVPCNQPELDGSNPRAASLQAGLLDHLRHYDITVRILDDDDRADPAGEMVELTLIIAGGYAAPKILRVATEILRVALLYGT